MTLHSRLIVALLLALVLPALGFAQGALAPSGPPAPTMRTLGELDASLTELVKKGEARIAVDLLPGDATALHVITQPGSYFLRSNLVSYSATQSAIRVTADGVTLDLNGFAVRGSGAGSTVAGIDASGSTLQRFVVRNGTIDGWSTGVLGANSMLAENLLVENSRVQGIYAGADSIVQRVQVLGSGGLGIRAGTVDFCRIRSVISDIGSARGIEAPIVSNCFVSLVIGSGSGTAYGILGTTVRDCQIGSVSTTGTGEACGLSAVHVRDCTVGNITTAGSGTATGISASTIAHSRVSSIQGEGSANGINGNGNVTRVIDCSVHTVSSTGASATILGIVAHSVSGTSVANISGGGSSVQGINSVSAETCTVTSVSSYNTGAVVIGISAANTRGCRVMTVNGSGATTYGISGVVITDNHVMDIGPSAGVAYGIFGSPSANIHHNTVSDTRTHGISGNFGSIIADNTVRLIGLDSGVNNGAGIYITSTGCRIVNNTIQGSSGSDYGIRVTGSQNFLTGNRCTGTFSGASTGATGIDSAEFNIVGANRWGDVVTAFAATGEIVATNPYCNFAD